MSIGNNSFPNTKTKGGKPNICWSPCLEVYEQVHTVDQTVHHQGYQSVFVGSRLWTLLLPSACRSFTSLQTGHTHTHTPSRSWVWWTASQLHKIVSRHYRKWPDGNPATLPSVQEQPRAGWVLPTKVIFARPYRSTFTWQASYTHRCPSTVTPASQLCNPASRHCGTTK